LKFERQTLQNFVDKTDSVILSSNERPRIIRNMHSTSRCIP